MPEALRQLAIELLVLAHRGSHPGQSGIERRQRFQFLFHGMFAKVKNFVAQCNTCAIFVDKKTKKPIVSHKVPSKCWETVAVGLFGPRPSSKHVVIVQNLGFRYPSAKLVASTKAERVIPALEEIYDEHGYPGNQISDNGPSFNSKKIKEFNQAQWKSRHCGQVLYYSLSKPKSIRNIYEDHRQGNEKGQIYKKKWIEGLKGSLKNISSDASSRNSTGKHDVPWWPNTGKNVKNPGLGTGRFRGGFSSKNFLPWDFHFAISWIKMGVSF